MLISEAWSFIYQANYYGPIYQSNGLNYVWPYYQSNGLNEKSQIITAKRNSSHWTDNDSFFYQASLFFIQANY